MSRSSVLIVAFGVETLDLDWVPDDVTVLIVHNDDRLRRHAVTHPGVRHLGDGTNRGFGAGMNLALAEVTTPRVILCNPDTSPQPEHFSALDEADDTTIVAVPLVESDGTPNAVVSPYWSLPAFLATAWRLGRVAPRGGRLRTAASRCLGSYGAGHAAALVGEPGMWPLSERWASGALVSLPTAAVRSVGGFDESYFLYFEDADLQQRLARSHPELHVSMKPIQPAVHLVGGSADQSMSHVVALHRRRSARTYASRQHGVGWRVAETALRVGSR